MIADYLRCVVDLRTRGYTSRTVAEFFQQPVSRSVILRHDVDRHISRAMQLAEAEARHEIYATYYFRCDRKGCFPEEACRHIAGLGHEVGYHYEDLSRSAGDREAALSMFARNLANLRQFAHCLTVSMHGSPFSTQDNRKLLQGVDLTDYDLIGDASISLVQFQPLYFTDAGGAWNNSTVNMRDRLGMMPTNLDPLRGDLYAVLQAHAECPLYFNLHPERWSKSRNQAVQSAWVDTLAGLCKKPLIWARK